MKTIKVSFKNCYGIRQLQTDFKYGKSNAVAVYAPNGTMKTSFSRTFMDFSRSVDSTDRVFTSRETERSITDGNDKEIPPNDVVVVPSYDESLGPTESTSTLLVNDELRKEYEEIQADLLDARNGLAESLKAQAKTKQDVISIVSTVFTDKDENFFEALLQYEIEREDGESPEYENIPHDIIFNEKVFAALKTKGVQAALADYVTRLNELLDDSEIFSRDAFSFYNATNVTKSLGENRFFEANHSVLLRTGDTQREIISDDELDELIAEEKKNIAEDDGLRKKLEAVEKALQKNVDTRRFFDYIASRETLLPEFKDIKAFQKKVWIAYLDAHKDAVSDTTSKFKSSKDRRREIEAQAAAERTQWENVIDIFNSRFYVPFRLGAENKKRVMLGQETVLKLVFKFEDGEESANVQRDELLSVLSNGEKKAFYILNVLFEVEARRATGRQTLFVIDDLADSFDYKNKYAIVQYLKEMSECENFKLILLTHNFDFFRALNGRGVASYNQCYMAQKAADKVVLNKAEHVNNPFIRGFKKKFFEDGMQRIASIPFVRNIIEYTRDDSCDEFMS